MDHLTRRAQSTERFPTPSWQAIIRLDRVIWPAVLVLNASEHAHGVHSVSCNGGLHSLYVATSRSIFPMYPINVGQTNIRNGLPVLEIGRGDFFIFRRGGYLLNLGNARPAATATEIAILDKDSFSRNFRIARSVFSLQNTTKPAYHRHIGSNARTAAVFKSFMGHI